MNERITEKIFEEGGRKFIISKFDPLFGAYLSLQLFGSLSDSSSRDINIENLITKLMGDNYEEFLSKNKKVLSYCREELPSGKVPVINSEGNIAIIGMTGPLLIKLIMETLMFSLQDFFGSEGENQ